MSVCGELRPRITAFLDGELADAEAATVASHLEACAPCRAARERIAEARRLLFDLPAPAPDPRAWQRVRREIRPPMSRAIRRTAWTPVPLWLTSGIAAGVLGLAVLGLRDPGRQGEAQVPTPPRDPRPPATQPADDGLDRVPAVPTQDDAVEPQRRPDVIPTPAEDPDADTPEPGTQEPAVELPPIEVPPPQSGVTTPEPDPDPEVDPAGDPEPGTPGVVPAGASAPAPRRWESVVLEPEDRPATLPGRPTYLPDARAFNPATGLPLPRGAGVIPIDQVRANGDLVFDRVGRGRQADFVVVSRRYAQQKGGVRLDVLVQHGDSEPERINITLSKTGPTEGDQWYLRNNTARYGKWMGEQILVIDGNHNGCYDDTELSQHEGIDAVLFPKRGTVVPLSRVLITDSGLVEFQVAEAGGRFRTRPYAGPTGAVTVADQYHGSGALTSVLIASGGNVFDVIAARRGEVRVPAGTYALAGGTFQSASVRMRILRGRFATIEVGESAGDGAAVSAASIALGGRCDLAFRLDGEPEAGHLSVACTSVTVEGEFGEGYEPVGKGLQRVRFALRRRSDGRLLFDQPTSVTRCPKNGHERFAVKLPNSVQASDLRVQMFAPDYERMFGSVIGAWAGE